MDVMQHLYANLIDFSPFPLSFFHKYNLSMSEFWWKFLVICNIFLVVISKLSISWIVQQIIPKVGVRTGIVKIFCAMCLPYADSLLDQIFSTRFLYSAVTLALLSGPTYPIFSSWRSYLSDSPSFNGLIVTPFITIVSWLSTIFILCQWPGKHT